jgi:hypothetical protein
MTESVRKRLTAWLGIVAMCLVVLAPVVSQLLVAARAESPEVALCSAIHDDAGHARADHGSGADPLAACGYCDFFADNIAAPGVPPMLPVLIVLVAIAAAPVLSTRFTPLGAFPSGRPRAPPLSVLSSL